MNDGFKQRLVGAIVLIAIALILWPVLFTDPAGIVMDRTSQIPETPAFDEYTIADPVRPKAVEPIRQPKPEPVKAEEPRPKVEPKPQANDAQPSTAQAKAKAVPRQDSQGLPEAWVLQVASFTQSQKAEDLKQALLDKGYKAYTRTIKTGSGKSTRVYMGPRFKKDDFNNDKKLIDKTYKVKSIVVQFDQ